VHHEDTFLRITLTMQTDEERAKKEEDDWRRQQGFRRVWQALMESQKPLVGHNTLLDMLFLVQHFMDELPETLSAWKSYLKENFVGLYDTRRLHKQWRWTNKAATTNGTADAGGSAATDAAAGASAAASKDVSDAEDMLALPSIFKYWSEPGHRVVSTGKSLHLLLVIVRGWHSGWPHCLHVLQCSQKGFPRRSGFVTITRPSTRTALG